MTVGSPGVLRRARTETGRGTPRPASGRAEGFGGLRAAWPFLLVGVALYAIFILYPVVRAIWLSFFDWSGVGAKQWVGWSNYTQLFTRDQVFDTALINTLIWTACALIVPNLLAIALAVALNGKIRGRVALRTAFYAPAVLATVVVAMTWNLVFDPSAGLFNNLLHDIGLNSLVRPWLGDPHFAIFAVFIASVWQTTGISMVLFSAGLQSVSGDLVQSAQVDGATRWQIFRHVELPALRPVTAIVLLLSVINALKAFDLIYAMTQGGPGDSSQVLASYAWSKALVNRDVGLGSAIATLLLVLALVAMVPYIRWILREMRHES